MRKGKQVGPIDKGWQRKFGSRWKNLVVVDLKIGKTCPPGRIEKFLKSTIYELKKLI